MEALAMWLNCAVDGVVVGFFLSYIFSDLHRGSFTINIISMSAFGIFVILAKVLKVAIYFEEVEKDIKKK